VDGPLTNLTEQPSSYRTLKGPRARAKRAMPNNGPITVELQREAIAEFCRAIARGLEKPSTVDSTGSKKASAKSKSELTTHSGNSNKSDKTDNAEIVALAPRLRHVLEELMLGHSEKQIAMRSRKSIHTIHDYVKQLYKSLGVNSRGELFARMREMDMRGG